MFGKVEAPQRLPSDYLADLERRGYTIMDGCLSAAMVVNVKANVQRVRERMLADPDTLEGLRQQINCTHDGMFEEPWRDLLARTPAIVRGATHPVALWLIRRFLGDELHFGHPPSFQITRPAKQLLDNLPIGGWHSDYPNPLSPQRPSHVNHLEYDQIAAGEDIDPATDPTFGPFQRMDREITEAGFPGWQDRKYRLGVQFNICVTDFTASNASTQFLLGTHQSDQHAPNELNVASTVAGVGIHKDVTQFEAPAGAALIYDSR